MLQAKGSSFKYRPPSQQITNLLTWTDAIIAQGPPCSWIRALGSSVEKIKPKGNNTSNQNKNNIIAYLKGKRLEFPAGLSMKEAGNRILMLGSVGHGACLAW